LIVRIADSHSMTPSVPTTDSDTMQLATADPTRRWLYFVSRAGRRRRCLVIRLRFRRSRTWPTGRRGARRSAAPQHGLGPERLELRDLARRPRHPRDPVVGRDEGRQELNPDRIIASDEGRRAAS
jgi:hypothetical protein